MLAVMVYPDGPDIKPEPWASEKGDSANVPIPSNESPTAAPRVKVQKRVINQEDEGSGITGDKTVGDYTYDSGEGSETGAKTGTGQPYQYGETSSTGDGSENGGSGNADGEGGSQPGPGGDGSGGSGGG